MAPPRLPPPSRLADTPQETESRFYHALQEGDIDLVMAVWADEEDIVCVWPRGERLMGGAAIRASFEQLLAKRVLDISLLQRHCYVSDDFAVHHVLEQLRIETPEGSRVEHQLATNVFLRTEAGWALLCHHASPATDAILLHAESQPPDVLH